MASSVGSHPWAREIVRGAWRQVFGRAPTEREAQGVQAVALFETNYGRGQGVNNWGSIHCVDCSDPNCSGGSDTDAAGVPYRTCFRNYGSAEAGAADLVRTMVRGNVAAALRTGSTRAVADAMHANHYFELAPEKYAERLAARATTISTALGEPRYMQLEAPFPWFAAILTAGAAAYFWTERDRIRTRLGPAYMALRRQAARFAP